jgi:hypothetical protein
MPNWHSGAVHGEVVPVRQTVLDVATVLDVEILVVEVLRGWLRKQQTRGQGFHRGGFESGSPGRLN